MKTSFIELNPFENSFLIKDISKNTNDNDIQKANLDFSKLSFSFTIHDQKDDKIYLALSNVNSPYLSKQQKQFLLKVYEKASDSYPNSQKLGIVPDSQFRYLSSPCITFYLSESTDVSSFAKSHLDFITSTFPILSKRQSIDESITHHASLDNTPKQIDNVELKRLNDILQFAIFDKSKPKDPIATFVPEQTSFVTEEASFVPEMESILVNEKVFNPFEIDETQDELTFSKGSTPPTTEHSISTSIISTSTTFSISNTSPQTIPNSILQKSLLQIQQSQTSIKTSNPFIIDPMPSKSSTQSTMQLSETIQVLSNQLKTMSEQIDIIDFSSLDGIAKSTDSTHMIEINTSPRPDWLW